VSWLFGPEVSVLLKAANDLAIPVEFQIDLAHVPAIIRLARASPSLCIVLEYLGSNSLRGEAGRRALATLGDCPAIHLKVLMAAEESARPWPHDDLWPFYRHALEVFGAERMMFGTAWPSQRNQINYPRAWQWLAGWPFLSARQLDLLHDGTARRVFSPASQMGNDR
jgi:L-fuconolactonase